MTRRIALFLCVMVLGWLTTAAGQESAAGEWAYKMDTPQGEVPARLVLAVEGNKLTGKFQFDGDRVLEISDGAVDGVKLNFKVVRNRPQGGSLTYVMTATVSATELRGTAETEMEGHPTKMEWVATRKK